MKRLVLSLCLIFSISALSWIGPGSSIGAPPMVKMIIEKDVPIPMRDGLKLAADIYRPEKPGKYLAIMGFTSHSKDGFWSQQASFPAIAYEP